MLGLNGPGHIGFHSLYNIHPLVQGADNEEYGPGIELTQTSFWQDLSQFGACASMAETRETPPYSCRGFLIFSVLDNTGCVIAGYNQMITAINNAINTCVGLNIEDKNGSVVWFPMDASCF